MRTQLDIWNDSRFGAGRDWFNFSPVLDRLFDDVIEQDTRRVHSSAVLTPACDVEESEGHFLIQMDMPGISKDDIRIETKDDNLIVTAERKHEKTETKGSHHLSERSYGKFYRSFSLGNAVDRSKIDAVYKDGVLRIALAKAEEAKPKQIAIGSDDRSGVFARLFGNTEKKTEEKQVV